MVQRLNQFHVPCTAYGRAGGKELLCLYGPVAVVHQSNEKRNLGMRTTARHDIECPDIGDNLIIDRKPLARLSDPGETAALL